MTASTTQAKNPAPRNLAEYSSFVTRLLANQPHHEVVPRRVMLSVIRASLSTSDLLDQCKKGFFYGKDTDRLEEIRDLADLHGQKFTRDEITFLHPVIGIRTEADELLEMVLEDQVDTQAVIDEAGDLLFYLQALLTRVGSSIPEAMRANVAKLLVRFPDGYNEAAATSPDKAAEADAQQGVLL